MKLLRFENVNEAKKQSTSNCEELAIDILTKELNKNALSRADMIKFIETNDEIIKKCEDDDTLGKVARSAADDLMHDPLKKKLGIKSQTVKEKGFDKIYFYIGDESGKKIKDISDKEAKQRQVQKDERIGDIKKKMSSNQIKPTKRRGKPTKESMITSFDDFIK